MGKSPNDDIQSFIDDDYCEYENELSDSFSKVLESNEPPVLLKAMMKPLTALSEDKVAQKTVDRSIKNQSLSEYLKTMDKPFAYKLLTWIDVKGMTDVECYKKATVDKKTFSKIKCNPTTYKPSKQTAVAFAIALELNLEETQDLLASAGLTLSRSFTFDKIIRYFLQKEIYDINEINEALFEFDQVLLGV